MIRALLDTDTFIELLRGKTPARQRARERPAHSLAISTVTLFELRVGVFKSKHPAKNLQFLEETLAPFSILPFDNAAAIEAARVRANLERDGRGIGPYDTLLAGHALSRKIELITGNTREFKRVAGLKLLDWRE